MPPVDTALALTPFTTGTEPASSLRDLGYVWLPGLLPPGDVSEVGAALRTFAAAAGWSPTGTFYDSETNAEEYWAVYRQVQACERFHALGHHPALVAAVEAALGEPVLCLPLKMARYTWPTSVRQPTPGHQDHFFIQGSADTVTAWVALHDVDDEGGGLVVRAGSHRFGLVTDGDEWPAMEAFPWHGGPFRAGDVLLFHSLTVHGARPNLRNDFRLSVDYRYQPLADPIAAESLHPHHDRWTWDELYDGWAGRAPTYYWRHRRLRFQERAAELQSLRGRVQSRFLG